MTTTRANSNPSYKRRLRDTLYRIDNGMCQIIGCGRQTVLGGDPNDGFTFNIGHVVSDVNGGEFRIENTVTICRRCNVDCGKRDIPADMLLRTPVRMALDPDKGTGQTNMEPGPLAR